LGEDVCGTAGAAGELAEEEEEEMVVVVVVVVVVGTVRATVGCVGEDTEQMSDDELAGAVGAKSGIPISSSALNGRRMDPIAVVDVRARRAWM
jgi:hypothetical protein